MCGANFAQECLLTHTHTHTLILKVSVCHQVLSELNQTTEKLQGETAARQNLSEEFQQVEASVGLAHIFLLLYRCPRLSHCGLVQLK